MAVRVVADLVTLAGDPRGECRVRVDAIADAKERRLDAEIVERVEQRGRALRIGAVVERQRDLRTGTRAVAGGVHHPVDGPTVTAVAEQVEQPGDRAGDHHQHRTDQKPHPAFSAD